MEILKRNMSSKIEQSCWRKDRIIFLFHYKKYYKIGGGNQRIYNQKCRKQAF